MEIIYKNILNKILTEQQAHLEEYMIKFFCIEGIVKKKEIYSDFILVEIMYYRELDENTLDILNLFDEYNDIYITIVEPVVYYGALYKECKTTYKNNVFVENYNSLFDQYDNEICYQPIEEDGLLEPLSYKETTKDYFGQGEEAAKGDIIFEAFYNEDGSLDYIDINIPGIGEKDYRSFAGSRLSELASLLPGNPDLSYYQNAILEPE